MKGLMNNKEAVRVFHNIKDSMDNPLHQIYNLGYKEGYKDGYNDKQDEIIQTLTHTRATEIEIHSGKTIER